MLATNLPAKAKGSLCAQKLTMPTTITGQNGAVDQTDDEDRRHQMPEGQKEEGPQGNQARAGKPREEAVAN